MAVGMVAMAVAKAVAEEMEVTTAAPARGEVASKAKAGETRVAALGAVDMAVVEENMAATAEKMAEAMVVA